MDSAGPPDLLEDIDFDDLTSPRLTLVQRQILEFTEARHVDFDIEKMLAQAWDQTGLAGDAELDNTDGFLDRLTAHVDAIEADDGLRQLTRSSLRQRVVRLLRNRLSLSELIGRFPEIESIPIDRPFIVVGMPRSGTTHLVNLIAADPRRRADGDDDDRQCVFHHHAQSAEIRRRADRRADARSRLGQNIQAALDA